MTTDSSERRDLDLTGVTAVEVATFNGDIIVEAGAGMESACIEATLRGKATYEVERLGPLLYVAAKKRGFTYLGSAASFHLRLPAGLALKLAIVNGAILVRGEARSVVATTYNGAVETRATGRGDVRVSAADGQITIQAVEGRVKVATSNGAVAVAEVRGQVEINTSNGAVRVTAVDGHIHAATSNGEVRIEDSAGQVQVATSNGGVRLNRVTLAAGTKNWAKTSAGAVEVLALRAPDGVSISAKTSGAIQADLPGYDVTVKKLFMLKARLPGAKPAALDIANAGGIRITSSS